MDTIRSGFLGLATVSLLLLLTPRPSAAQSVREQADDAFAASEWNEAARLYRQVVAAKADDSAAWYQLGRANSEAGDYAAAIASFEQALDLGYSEVAIRFQMARAAAASGETSSSLGYLERLAAIGSSRGLVRRVETEVVFESVRADPRLSDILLKLTPCTAPAYREFDFWIGEWEVQNPQGQVVGHNTISELLDGCLLLEDWEGSSGHKGISINYYDTRSNSWVQMFRDNTGNIGSWPDILGGLVDGKMVLETAAGTQPMSRWTWTRISDQKVRQMAESSNDNGETWTVTWDSYYIRQE